jgi:hypothetical protein
MSFAPRASRWPPKINEVHALGFTVARRSSIATPRRRGVAGEGSSMAAYEACVTSVRFLQKSMTTVVKYCDGRKRRWWRTRFGTWSVWGHNGEAGHRSSM